MKTLSVILGPGPLFPVGRERGFCAEFDTAQAAKLSFERLQRALGEPPETTIETKPDPIANRTSPAYAALAVEAARKQ